MGIVRGDRLSREPRLADECGRLAPLVTAPRRKMPLMGKQFRRLPSLRG